MPREGRNPSHHIRRRMTKDGRERIQAIVTYPDPDKPGKWKHRGRTFATAAEATKWITLTKAEHYQNPWYTHAKDQPLETFLTQWLGQVIAGRVQDTTELRYRQGAAHVIEALGARRVSTLQPPDFDNLYSTLLREGKAPRTIQRVHFVVRKALADAVAWGVLTRNPVDSAHPPRATLSIHPPTPDQLRTLLLAAQRDALWPLWVLLASTGMRKGEALALRWEHFDADRGILTIAGTQAATGGPIRIHQPKTASGRRNISLSADLVQVLAEHRLRQAAFAASTPNWEDHGWVFTTRKGTPLGPSHVHRAFKRLLGAAGLPHHIRLHDLRHAMATAWLARGIPGAVVAERLGHANPGITDTLYAHVVPNMQAEAVVHMDAWLLDGLSCQHDVNTTAANARESKKPKRIAESRETHKKAVVEKSRHHKSRSRENS